MKNNLLLFAMLPAVLVLAQTDIMPRPPHRPDTRGPLIRLIRETRIGEPCRAKNMTVYPLFSADCAHGGYLTLDEALARKALRITEKGDGNVPELLAENTSGSPVFLLAGEIVTGGKQNRVISQDLLLAPHSGPISLGVFCVERGRWTVQTKYFGAEKELAHGQLRQQLNSPANTQSHVWAEVARKSAAVAPSVAASTSYLGAALDDVKVKRGMEEYAKPITLPPSANGMAVVIGGRVAGVEIFGDRETFARLRDKLLRSYAVDAMECIVDEKPAPDAGLVEAFVRRFQDAQLVVKQSVGIGRLFGIEGGLCGSALTWHEQRAAHSVVHISLFEEATAPIPMRPTGTRPLLP